MTLESAETLFPELAPEAVRARIEHARCNGYPRWLWSNISLEDWRSAVEAITVVTRNVLCGVRAVVFECRDPMTAGIAGYTSGMGPLLGHWIETGAIGTTQAIADVFRLHLAHNQERMARMAATARDMTGALAAAGIAPVVVKGMHTAFRYFPEPGARALSDIDLYIPMESMAAAEKVFAQRDYLPTPRMGAPYACDWTLADMRAEPRTLAYVHRDDPWSFDVLGSLNRRLITGRQMKLDALFEPAQTSAWPLSGHARVLTQPLLALHLAAHISQTLLSATLLRIAELVLVLRADAGVLDWDAFLAGAAKIGGARLIYPALSFCEQLAPGTVPNRVLDVCEEDAPRNLRQVVGSLSVGAAQPLGRHSLRERFMWAGTWRERLQQVAGELALDGRREPLPATLRSVGTKLWALRRGRYTA